MEKRKKGKKKEEPNLLLLSHSFSWAQ